ncbi:hypothetical protein AXF42_Ash020493 [Apostasia shenzhenica]|uniref:Pentatricopeptide repeat-containing protein n=1 Tax=Apostasia shenzhenica TaxID=1088818 RepID=A0A2H9ZZ93_9ASPA|nr:hypothetical protein AXF42_Ash020493 [Apostasia shenzhenica]
MATSAGCLLIVLFHLCATIESSDATGPPAGWISMLGKAAGREDAALGACDAAMLAYRITWPYHRRINHAVEVYVAGYHMDGFFVTYRLVFLAMEHLMKEQLDVSIQVFVSLIYRKHILEPFGSVGNVKITTV